MLEDHQDLLEKNEMQDKKAGASSVHDLPTSTLKRVEWDNVYFLLSNA